MNHVRKSACRNGLMLWALVVAALCLAPACRGQQPGALHLHLDPEATQVQFTIKDSLHTVHGNFHLSNGEIDFNPQTGEAHGLVSVDTASGASGNDGRDRRMKHEFLEVVKFPVATFEPQRVVGYNNAAERRQISVSGVMTVHGASHPMVLEFTVIAEGGVTTAITHFTIPYVAWGLKDPSIAFVRVEKEVAMSVVAKGALTAGK